MDDWTRIARYLNAEQRGRPSSEEESFEEEAFQQWLAADPDRKQKLKAAQAIWESASADDQPGPNSEGARQHHFDAEVAWAQVASRVGVPVEPTTVEPTTDDADADDSDAAASRESASAPGAQRRSRRSPRRSDRTRSRLSQRGRGIALVAVLVVAGLIVYVSTTRFGTLVDDTSVEPSVVATAHGQRATVRLADGSTVMLAPDSELRYPDTFADSTRRVALRGQAFFDVVPEAARPFRIRARNTTTEVIGTAFSIEAYPETGALRVVVAEGRVSVTDDRSRNSATVSRGEIATVTQGQVTTAFAQDLDAELAWRDGQLPFRQTPLPEVLRALERWYAVDMTLADSTLSQRRLTAEFDGESLSEALEVLRLLLDVPIQQSDSSVVIAPSDELPPRR